MGATTVKVATVTSDVSVIENLSKTTLKDKNITHQIVDNLELKSGSTPDAELIYSGNIPLSSGTATIDLKALANSEGTTIVTEGKKVRVFKAKAADDNANPLTLTFGASSAYLLAGAAWKVILNADDSVLFILNDNAPAISSSTKDIDLSGTDTQSVDIIIIFG